MAMQFARAQRAATPQTTNALAQQTSIANQLRAAENQAEAQGKANTLNAGVGLTGAGLQAASAAGATGLGGTLAAMGPVGWAGLAALALGAL